ncbi:hypothetical protein EDC01DRAFT_666862 [Geopyxis carbonaria]|nr:hypothetical protein EDC01DRAFT_666862 [Geopyxis carbonaria]
MRLLLQTRVSALYTLRTRLPRSRIHTLTLPLNTSTTTTTTITTSIKTPIRCYTMPPKKPTITAAGSNSAAKSKKQGKQSTLGSFFSLPAGTKPPVLQQTRLKGTSATARRIELESSEDEVEPAAVKEEEGEKVNGKQDEAASEDNEGSAAAEKVVEKLEEVKVEDDEVLAKNETVEDKDEVMVDADEATEDTLATTPPEPAAAAKKDKSKTKTKAKAKAKAKETKVNGSKKRARTPEEPATKKVKSEEPESASEKPISEAEEDDEPATKRGRRSKSDAAKPKKEPKPKKQAATPAKKPASPKKSAKKVKAEVKEEKESSPEPEVEAEASASEVDADDVKKPAISATARKEVQSKLTKGAKEPPYPDWKAGTPIPYAALVKTFNLVEATTKRLEKLSHTSLFLRQVLRLSPDELLLVVHLMINRLAADYEGVELGIGESLLMKAIAESCGRSMQKLKEDQKEIGDLGEVAMKSRNTQKTLFAPKPLTIKGVHATFKEIALIKGDGGQGRKVSAINKMLSAAKGDEAKYIVRALEGKLRLGLAERTVIVGLSQSVIVHEHEQAGKKAPSIEQMTAAEEVLKAVYSELPNYEIIVGEMMKGGIMNLKDTCKLQPGVPLKPMLAKPTKSITEVLDRFENKRFTCEYKYDGERVQLHYVAPNSAETYAAVDKAKGIAKIFSRNSEELSPKYPDILAALGTWVKPGVESFVMDCEAVAWDRAEKRVLPFQQLMTRKRKDVALADVKIAACVFGFDLLFLNGVSLVHESLEARRTHMHTQFTPTEGEFAFATSTDGQELDTIQSFLDDSIKASCEGLMVKMLDGPESWYEPSKRSRNWLKVKKDYLAGAGDSLDLVVIGGYHGRGKRTAVYGAFLLAVYNPATQNFESICNIGTGFSEEVLKTLHTTLSEFEIEKPKPYYLHATGGVDQPDVWFEPRVVWEVKTADISLSPKYMAGKGLVEGNKGISLRFPRYIRDREDKKPEDATTGVQLAEMYRRQDVVANNAKSGKGVDDDYEY